MQYSRGLYSLICSLPLAWAALACSGAAPGVPGESATAAPSQPPGGPAEPAAITASPTPSTEAAPARTIDWSRYFGDRKACFMMLSSRDGTIVQNDQERCQTRFRPFSTFKIPNAIIGLETGAVSGPDEIIEWNKARYPAQDYWPAIWAEKRHDLRSAMEHSVVPYFRAMAVRIGAEAMQSYVSRFGYGNQSIAGGLDHFWLDGDIAISAAEQIQFLRALHERRLPVSARSTDIVESILINQRGPDHVLYAKTGTGNIADDHIIGWYVGYVVRGDAVYYFALNLSARTMSEIPRQARIALAQQILTDLGALP